MLEAVKYMLYLTLFWYSDSNSMYGKTEMRALRITKNFIYEEKIIIRRPHHLQ